MKNINFYNAEKYESSRYTAASPNIYTDGKNWFVSFSFEQEPTLGEGKDSSDISQYPLEDILDRFLVYISDFYKKENAIPSPKCCLEFAGTSYETVKNLSTIVGKHVYNKQVDNNGTEEILLIIE